MRVMLLFFPGTYHFSSVPWLWQRWQCAIAAIFRDLRTSSQHKWCLILLMRQQKQFRSRRDVIKGYRLVCEVMMSRVSFDGNDCVSHDTQSSHKLSFPSYEQHVNEVLLFNVFWAVRKYHLCSPTVAYVENKKVRRLCSPSFSSFMWHECCCRSFSGKSECGSAYLSVQGELGPYTTANTCYPWKEKAEVTRKR